jgi:acetyl-CoA acetyltransferase
MMCASGMQAVILAVQAIQAGSARMVLCGGTESMSNAPYLLDRARGPVTNWAMACSSIRCCATG